MTLERIGWRLELVGLKLGRPGRSLGELDRRPARFGWTLVGPGQRPGHIGLHGRYGDRRRLKYKFNSAVAF